MRFIERISGVLQAIDLAVLGHVYQPLSERLEALTGRNCFFFSAQSVAAGCATYVVRIAMDSDVYRTGEPSATDGILFFNVAIMLLVWGRIYRMATRWQDRRTGGSMNPLSILFSPCRLLILSFVIIDLFLVRQLEHGIVSLASDALLTSAVYFLSCTPRPPLRRYIRLVEQPA